jgi:glycosyltransferase involved in cell wall biosynthesis
MRLALTHAHCWPDVRRGGERYLHELATALARHGHDVTIWSTSGSAPGEQEEAGVRVVRLRPHGGGDAATQAWFGAQVLPHLLKERYDAIHSLLPTDALAAVAARRAGRAGRAVYTNLGIPDRANWARRPDRRRHERVVAWTDDYGCLSHAAARALLTTFGRRPVITPGGVDLERFQPSIERATHPTLLYSGTFDDPMKNLPVLVEAFACLLERRPDARLQLCGPGDPAPLLAGLPPSVRDQVEVLPLATPDLAAVYAAAWVTVLPSKWESFALVLTESLACGTPIVTTRHSASPERVVPGAGVLCQPDDVAGLAAACEEGLDLARQPGIRERCRAAAAEWSWDALVPHYELVYAGEAPLFDPERRL